MRTRDLYRYSLTVGLLAVLAIFLLWPIWQTVQGAFTATDADGGGFTLKYFVGDGIGVLRDPLYRQGLMNSLIIAASTTVLCLIITMPMAMLAARYSWRGKGIVTSLVLVPLILPPFVGAIGLRALLGRFGALNALLGFEGPGIDFLGGALGGRLPGVILMEALHLYPILYLNITAALANLDPALDEAAVNLGAGRVRRFFKCTLPLIVPGIFAGATIVFIWSFTELGTPLMFDYYTVTPVQVFWGINEVAQSPRPYALVVVMLAVAVGLYVLGKWAFGGKAYAMQSKASVAAQMTDLKGAAGLGAMALFVVVTLLAVMPHIGVLLYSVSKEGAWFHSVLPQSLTLKHFDAALTHELATRAITNSILYALAAMVLCTIIGLAIAYINVRGKVRGSGVLDALAMLPLAVPGIVMAFGYVAMSLRWPFGDGPAPGWLQTLCWPLPAPVQSAILDAPFGGLFSVLGEHPNPIPLLIIAYAIRRLPYIVRSASAGLEQTSGQLEEAAQNLGASTATTIRRIVVPLIMANLIAGGILVFAFSMLEVSDSLILAQKAEHFPITKAIWEFFSRLGDGPYIASAMGVWGMLLLTVTLVGASVLMGKKLGAIFRV